MSVSCCCFFNCCRNCTFFSSCRFNTSLGKWFNSPIQQLYCTTAWIPKAEPEPEPLSYLGVREKLVRLTVELDDSSQAAELLEQVHDT